MNKITDDGIGLAAMIQAAVEIHTILGKYNLTLGVIETESGPVGVVMAKVPGPGKPMVTVTGREVWTQ